MSGAWCVSAHGEVVDALSGEAEVRAVVDIRARSEPALGVLIAD